MPKTNYLIKRPLAATIDVLFFALIVEIIGPFFEYKSTDGTNYIPTGIFILLFYAILIIQDVIFNKTLGKYLFKLEIQFENDNQIKGYKKYFKLTLRRLFDPLEMICPFIYILSIIFTKKNQKLGDLISGIVILKKNSHYYINQRA